jgi:hypothetical protein
VMSVCCRSILVHLAMSLLSTFARTNGTTPREVSSSLSHVDFGVCCLRWKLTLKKRLSG